MREQIVETLSALEHEHQVRVLFACESGSRAWGFPSPDSDFDVRFVYAHPVEWHLQVGKTRDTIDLMLPSDLDLGGWELKKALTLFAGCNVPLNEWLGSPILYAEKGGFRADLQRLVAEHFNGKKALHHYLSLAAKTAEVELKGSEIRIKKLFYILRPLYACRWIIVKHTMPPTFFPAMLGQGLGPEEVESEIRETLELKVSAREGQTIRIAPSLSGWIRVQLGVLEEEAAAYPPPNDGHSLAGLDQLLRHHTLSPIRRPHA